MPSWSTFWPNRPKMHVAGFTLTPSDWYRRLMNVEAGWGIWTAWVLVLNRHILKPGTHWRHSWIQQSQLYRQQSWPYRQHSWTGRQQSRPRQDVEFTLLLICCQNRHQSWTYMATVNFVAGCTISQCVPGFTSRHCICRLVLRMIGKLFSRQIVLVCHWEWTVVPVVVHRLWQPSLLPRLLPSATCLNWMRLLLSSSS